jgi:hypothetical protein
MLSLTSSAIALHVLAHLLRMFLEGLDVSAIAVYGKHPYICALFVCTQRDHRCPEPLLNLILRSAVRVDTGRRTPLGSLHLDRCALAVRRAFGAKRTTRPRLRGRWGFGIPSIDRLPTSCYRR